MSRTTHHIPINRVKARHNNAIPYKRERWSVIKELEVGDVEITIERRK